MADWNELGIAPTTDVDAVRAAYRQRLKTTGPESDPEGFEKLRAAHDRVIAAITAPSTGGPGGDPGDAEPAPPTPAQLEAMEVANQVSSFRLAGNVDGAIAYLEEEMASMAPGSEELTALEMHLFYGTALGRSVSPKLFRWLVDRFDWTDMQGLVAQDNPEAHAVLLDRLAAEDWWDAARNAAQDQPPGRVAAALTGDGPSAQAILRTNGLSQEERQDVRRLFDELGQHARFLLPRLDGQSLALLREAVEGPPSVDTSQPGTPMPDASSPPPQPDPLAGDQGAAEGGVTGWLRKLAVAAVLLLAGVGIAALLFDDDNTGTAGNPGAPSADLAMAELRKSSTDWVDIDRSNGAVTVLWTPLLRWRSGIGEMRMAVDRPPAGPSVKAADFDTMYPMPVAPMMNELTIQLRYADGEWSEVRSYDISGVEL